MCISTGLLIKTCNLLNRILNWTIGDYLLKKHLNMSYKMTKMKLLIFILKITVGERHSQYIAPRAKKLAQVCRQPE